MANVVVVVPGWLSPNEDDSVLRPGPSAVAAMARRAKIERLTWAVSAETPEAAWLGIDPERVRLASGPLAVAALGADPPARSVHFQVSLLSLTDGRISPLGSELEPDVRRRVAELGQRLDTRRLTTVWGPGTEHGLVWEDGSIDLACTSPDRLGDRTMAECLPEGDGESMLRRFVDDSVNLLADEEFNRRRMEEGLPPANILWPWGPGFRNPVPNLLLERGRPLRVESRSLRLQGLARLAKATHGRLDSMGSGTATRLDSALASAQSGCDCVLVIDAVEAMRAEGRLEEVDWLTHEIDRRLLRPLWESTADNRSRLSVVALRPGAAAPGAPPTSDCVGLAMTVGAKLRAENVYPFDERSLDERTLNRRPVWQAIEEALVWQAVE
ncbi:MAG: hypothetical protein SNJ74_05400 [Fimbriimonadaceae bacterium]